MRVALSWHVAAALGVIGNIPARALELESGRGHQPMHVCAALIVNRYRLVGELLDNFEGFAAAFAFVFVNWQRSKLYCGGAVAGFGTFSGVRFG
jgi:hypothetical protein